MNKFQKKLVPELRFDEFSGDWTNTNVLNLVKDGILLKPQDGNHGEIHPKSSDYVDKGIPFVMSNNIHNGNLDLLSCKHIPKTVADNLQKGFSREGDVLLTHKGTVGEVALVNKIEYPYLMLTPQVTYYRIIDSEQLYNIFLARYFVSPNFQKRLKVEADSGTRPYIGIIQQGKLPVVFPKIKEQQKIANFLTAVDQRISLLKQKTAALETYKKGLMQKIFSQEIRFKDENGDDYPDWVEKRLGEVYDLQGGGTPSTSNKSYWNGDIDWFTPTEMKSKYCNQSKRKITQSGLQKSSAKLLPIGSLLFTSRATIGDMSIALKECSTNQGFQSFLPSNKNDLEFLYYWILNNRKIFIRMSSGSTFLEISKKEIEKIKIDLAVLREQKKIADCLSSMDQSINKLKNQIEQTTQFKKGLLQKMFV